MSSEEEKPCRCPVRPYGPSMASGSAWETNRLREWDAKHAYHDYAKARDELAKALQYAEGAVWHGEQRKAGEAVLDMVADVFGHKRCTHKEDTHKQVCSVAVGEEVTFYPKDGSAALRARIASAAPDGWWDLDVDNVAAEDGTPHRYFTTRSRPANPFDSDRRGLFAPDVFKTPGSALRTEPGDNTAP